MLPSRQRTLLHLLRCIGQWPGGHGYHVNTEHRIPVEATDFIHVAQTPISPGDVDVVKNKSISKLRNGQKVRTKIATRLLAVAEASPLEYVEVDGEKVGQVHASEVILECCDGELNRVQRVVIVQSTV